MLVKIVPNNSPPDSWYTSRSFVVSTLQNTRINDPSQVSPRRLQPTHTLADTPYLHLHPVPQPSVPDWDVCLLSRPNSYIPCRTAHSTESQNA